MTGDISDDVDADALQTELEEIKGAIGLASDHPYWWRFWVVEGVGAGVLFVVIQLLLRGVFRPWIAIVFVGVIVGSELLKRRFRAAYEPPTTGLPSQRRWTLVLFAGITVLIVGLRPVFEQLGETNSARLALVSAGAVVGVGYVFMGQLLAGYNIRAVDRYAFIVGGAWIMVLSAVIPYVPLLEGWEYAALGIGIAVHHVGTYVVLSRH